MCSIALGPARLQDLAQVLLASPAQQRPFFTGGIDRFLPVYTTYYYEMVRKLDCKFQARRVSRPRRVRRPGRPPAKTSFFKNWSSQVK